MIYILNQIGLDYDNLSNLVAQKIIDREVITIDDFDTSFLNDDFIKNKESNWQNYLDKDNLDSIEFSKVVSKITEILVSIEAKVKNKLKASS
ncbi:hypothetical protein RJG79_09930 [Mycoplasmatota bacterium WC44]